MTTVEELIVGAKRGDPEAVNRLVQRYRNYLAMLLQASNVDLKRLRARFDDSDVIQDTLLDAFRDFARFEGTCEAELVAWLRKMLACNLADLVREHHAEKRDVNRQVSLDASLTNTSLCMEQLIPQNRSHPSGFSSRQELVVMLADSLARLPADYREVLILRHINNASFEEIAEVMGRTSGAVRMLWTRAIERLRIFEENA